MNVARQDHISILLPNGKVLVAGGFSENGSTTAISSAEIYDPATNSWNYTGSLITGRGGMTAVLLPNGKVLVAGGKNGSFLSSVELYDPNTRGWTALAPMHMARAAHTATLLPNGKVLVTGGYGGGNSAELYDPATNQWTLTGSMSSPRADHTATLLQDGRVLVAGGNIGYPNISSGAELYNSNTGTWSTGAAMSSPREYHTATLLPNGKVLVAGGASVSNPNGITLPATAELYDPSTNTWANTGSMSNGCYWHTATLLPDGNVVVAGGAYQSTIQLYINNTNSWQAVGSLGYGDTSHAATLLPNSQILITGGTAGSYSDNNMELIEISAPVVSPTTTGLQIARYAHTATLLPATGKVLVVGGKDSSAAINSAELYDPTSGNWSVTGSLNLPRQLHSATLLADGRVLVVGGRAGGVAQATVEVYNPATGAWRLTNPLKVARYSHTATLLSDGRVLVVGGVGSNTNPLDSAEIYDPLSGVWSQTASLHQARYSHTATLLPDGRVLVVGGYAGSALSSAELYDPTSALWGGTTPLTTARYAHTATLIASGKVLVVGGSANATTVLDSAELYDFGSQHWTSAASLGAARQLHSATLLNTGQVLVAGGLSSTGTLTNTELYDPLFNSWNSLASLGQDRAQQTATLLVDGRVLLAGGISKNGANAPTTVLSSAELYEDGRGQYDSYRPQISLPPSSPTLTLTLGSSLTLQGKLFGGFSEASGGAANSSATNYPLLQLRSIESNQTVWLATQDWSNFGLAATTPTATLTTAPLNNFPVGYALATLYVNGVPSLSQFLQISPVCNPLLVTSTAEDGSCGTLGYSLNAATSGTFGKAITIDLPSGSVITLTSGITLGSGISLTTTAQCGVGPNNTMLPPITLQGGSGNGLTLSVDNRLSGLWVRGFSGVQIIAPAGSHSVMSCVRASKN